MKAVNGLLNGPLRVRWKA